MLVILRRTPHGDRAHPLLDKELKVGLKDGTIERVNGDLYREVVNPPKPAPSKKSTVKKSK